MRIERIRGTNLTGLGDVDLTFPAGPVLLFSEDRSRQKGLVDLLLELFYDFKPSQAAKAQSRKSLVELWMTEESTRLYIYRHRCIQQDNGLERPSTLVIEDENGQKVSLPETMMLGEYLFRVTLQAFCQGGVMDWPDNKENCNFVRRVYNMRRGGDERLSLSKVRAAIAGAQKRVQEQTESMGLVKAEYDALRHEWEDAHRQQEKERLLLIEQKNLQEKEKILAERISNAEKMHERLSLLRQNPDYRELRQLQGELTQMEDYCREAESNLTALTRKSQVDWAVIDSLRGECMEWAFLQAEVSGLAAKAQMLAQEINELQNILQMSGYQGVTEDEVQRLRRTEEERNSAQEELESELENLTNVKRELEKVQIVFAKEMSKLQVLAVMAGVTDTAEIKTAQRERHLAQWQNSKIGRFLDRTLRDKFGLISIDERLSLRLAKYYQTYHASNYKEFKSQLKEFRNQRQLVERLERELEQLQEKARWEEKLRRIMNSRATILERAFRKANVADFSAWLNGWEDHRQKRDQLDLWQDELRLELERQNVEESKMAAAAEQLREKLEPWATSAKDRDEILVVVLKVAIQLRVKDEADREFAVFSKKYFDLLGNRNIEQLAKTLEPLAELEREILSLNEERPEELSVLQKERVEIRLQLKATEQSLQHGQKFPSLSVLDKKIEKVKKKWTAYEDLHRALDDVETLLENSWQEWKTKSEKALEVEKQWIISQMSPSLIKGTIDKDGIEGKRAYFAYRMAIAQLAFRDNLELPPLFFSVGEMNEGQGFWKEVLGYLHKQSHSRQVVLATSDIKLWQKLAENDGWQRLVF